VFAIDVDSPEQHSAMIEKLRLPFPMLSDPDRSAAIEPLGVANHSDPRSIAIPAIIVVAPTGEEVIRIESRDFADRIPEDELLERLRALELTPAGQDPPEPGPAEAGPRAMPVSAMEPYWRGARFAVTAMKMRFPETGEDADAYVAMLDRYIEAVRELKGNA
jgi:hypothetical protein